MEKQSPVRGAVSVFEAIARYNIPRLTDLKLTTRDAKQPDISDNRTTGKTDNTV